MIAVVDAVDPATQQLLISVHAPGAPTPSLTNAQRAFVKEPVCSTVWPMDGQWAVVVGAGLGASGAVVGALVSWFNVRLQARVQLRAAQLEHAAQRESETIARKRSAYADLILTTDATRRQMRMVRQHMRTNWPTRGTDSEFQEKRTFVHDRIREMQAAEWVLRLMLADEEQASVTDLVNAVYTTHQALIDDADAWLAGDQTEESRAARDTERYQATTQALQTEMMSFANSVHTRLYRSEPPSG
ncbi:hypothetical protein [Streptomyces crystallinus]|uniref:Uncharacterized protein n=1 Tax=Streptomyces crystallinus TaxID=68191 RepID=A0ABN1GJB4_9ACTN